MTSTFDIRGTYAELALLLLVAGTIYGWIAAYDTSTMAFQDAIEYLQMADFYRSTLFGATLADGIEYYRSTRLPPLFPLLLALFGAGSEHQHTAAIVMAGTSAFAALAVWNWRRSENSENREGLGIALALLLFPGFFLINLHPVSEPLAIAILCSALALLAGPRLTSSRLFVASLLIGLAPLARTALLPLPIAFSIWVLIERRTFRSVLLPIVCAWAPIFGWMAYRNAIGSDTYFHYVGEERLAGGLGPWPDALWIQPRRLLDAWLDSWGVPAGIGIKGASILIGAFALLGSLVRLRQNRLDAWFLGGYVLLILVWPFPFELQRFLVVVYPLILVCTLGGLRLLAGGRSKLRHWPAWVLAIAVAIATMPALARFIPRAALPVDPELLGDKRELPFFRIEDEERALFTIEVFVRMRLLSEEAGNHVSSTECVYSVHPELQRLYGRTRAERYPLDLAEMTPSDAEKRLNRCDWFILNGFDTAEPALPAFYPSRSLQGWTEAVLSSEFRRDGRKVSAGLLLRRSPQDTGVKDNE